MSAPGRIRVVESERSAVCDNAKARPRACPLGRCWRGDVRAPSSCLCGEREAVPLTRSSLSGALFKHGCRSDTFMGKLERAPVNAARGHAAPARRRAPRRRTHRQ